MTDEDLDKGFARDVSSPLNTTTKSFEDYLQEARKRRQGFFMEVTESEDDLVEYGYMADGDGTGDGSGWDARTI
ncbi:hypothetical protein TWF481_002842 [Arthrobotrys musiformis]|uniref:CCD97-like C-terminal domain-containing protein n=1 Tax=Arthrobotrys musiformis TaxID=47236 RepID=A0AAV9VRE8_9PEZI